MSAPPASSDPYRVVVDDLTEVVCRFKPDGTLTFVNEVACRLFGKKADEIIGARWQPKVLASDLSHVDALLREMAPSSPVVVIENRVFNAAGEVRWMQFVNRGFFDADGRLLEIQSVGRDITERRRIDEALLANEQRFRAALATAPIVVFNQDRNLRYTWVGNPALGLGPKEGLGRTDEEILGAAAAAPLVAIKRRVLETGRGERHELALSRKGQVGWFDLMLEPLRDAAGNLVGITGAALDITERKKAEAELRESRTLLHQMGESAPDAVFVIDHDYRLLFSNRQHQGWLAASGRPPLQVGESVLSPSDPKETRELWQAAYARALHGEKVELATTWTDTEGRDHVSESMLSPLRDAQGAIFGVLAAARDVTERQRTAADLRRSHEALRALTARVTNAREEERQRISREIHDELGHSFAALKLDLAWVDRRLKERGLTARSVARRRLAAMMRRAEADLEMARRIAATLRPALLDTLGLAAALEWEARQFESRARIRCELELPGRPVALDPGRATAVFRICQEALSNVALHAASATRVRVALSCARDRLRLEVSDDGAGIAAGRAEDPGAMGILGMRERALEFGGTFAISGAPGRGTTVALELPLSPA
jgi:PAS domain S-box-containing protein